MPDTHIAKDFDRDLARLDEKISRMGALAEEELESSLRALRRRDPEMAEQAILRDREIDRLEQEVEDGAVTIIALRQPMANDLRMVIGILKISSELERIGDLSKNISRRVITLAENKPPKPLKKGLKRMGKQVIRQLRDVLDAYVARDAQKAREVWERDEEIDEAYNSIFRELLTYMMEDPRTIGMCTHLLFGARNLERIGDHVTNIAENIHYMVTGERLDVARPKGDETSNILPQAAVSKKSAKTAGQGASGEGEKSVKNGGEGQGA